MPKIHPKKAAEAPMAAAILSTVLARHGKATKDPDALSQAEELKKIALENEKTPSGPMARPVRKLIKAMKPLG